MKNLPYECNFDVKVRRKLFSIDTNREDRRKQPINIDLKAVKIRIEPYIYGAVT
jgi:hypothetical protein